MTKFKALISINQFFTFKGANFEAQDGFFETDDKELIEFLKVNSNFELIETKGKKDAV